MKGTRLYAEPEEEDFLYRVSTTPGAYGVSSSGQTWYCTTPNGLFGNLGAHQVTEHEDGTITVSPSILVTAGRGGQSYHGFLIRGIWNEC